MEQKPRRIRSLGVFNSKRDNITHLDGEAPSREMTFCGWWLGARPRSGFAVSRGVTSQNSISMSSLSEWQLYGTRAEGLIGAPG